jgi:hypothetical protein
VTPSPAGLRALASAYAGTHDPAAAPLSPILAITAGVTHVFQTYWTELDEGHDALIRVGAFIRKQWDAHASA